MKNARTTIALALLIIVATALVVFHPWQKGVSPTEAEPTYASSIYKVSLSYPEGWKPVDGYDTDRFEGPDGFFQISAAGENLDLASVVDAEADHVLSPYGTAPNIHYIVAGGQQAALITPSKDQDPSMRSQAALIAAYPKPLTIGGQTYYYFVLWADKDHIGTMADSLQFLP